jgi:hypothetical protein
MKYLVAAVPVERRKTENIPATVVVVDKYTDEHGLSKHNFSS